MDYQLLNDLPEREVIKLLESFERILFDVGGVLILAKQLIPGADKFIGKLRQLEKKIGFVTNNTVYPMKKIVSHLKPFNVKSDEVTTPLHGIMYYLNKIEFKLLKKDIFVIGSDLLIGMLKNAGYNVITYKDIQNEPIDSTLEALGEVARTSVKLCKNVGAMILCADFNFTFPAAQVAITILQTNKDVILLSGMIDDAGPLSDNLVFIGPKFYINAIERLGNRKCLATAKPSTILKDIVIEKYGIKDPSRVLFIGDNVSTDMHFAQIAGFKKLLVLSGATTKEKLQERLDQEQVTPDYVVDSLGKLYEKYQFAE